MPAGSPNRAVPTEGTEPPGETPPPEPAGTVRILASGQDEPRALVIDDTAVYWVNHGSEVGYTGQVMRMDKTGGVVTALASNQLVPEGIAVDGAFVYWTNRASDSGKGQVLKVAKGGGVPTVLVDGLSYPTGLNIDADYVYWNSYFTNDVRRVAKLGGAVTTLTKMPSSDPLLTGIAVDSGDVYFMSGVLDSVYSVPKTGGVATRRASHTRGTHTGPGGIVVDGTDVFFTGHSEGALGRLDMTTGMFTSLFSGQYNLRFIAVDDKRVYAARYGSSGPRQPGAILSVPRAGGPGSVLTEMDRGGPWGIAVDAKHVYFTNIHEGTVNSITK